jgi:hypothetical protein
MTDAQNRDRLIRPTSTWIGHCTRAIGLVLACSLAVVYLVLVSPPDEPSAAPTPVASDSGQSKLFAATSDNRLWARDPILSDVDWQHIGHANVVVVMTALPEAAVSATLEELKSRMGAVLAKPNVEFVDADETCGCVTVGISASSAVGSVASVAASAGVPSASVKTVLTTPITALVGLRDAIRPIKGGRQIQNEDRSFCTMTATVLNRARQRKGLLTNSHCTRTQNAVDGIKFFQAGGALFSGDFVARELIDPPPVLAGCPAERECRRSDAAFAEFDTSTVGIVGQLARPSHTCTGTDSCDVTMADSTASLRIAAVDREAPRVGDQLDRIGRSSGWTRGPVTRTCVDTNVADTNMTMLCQHMVAATSIRGDSGSPVFRQLQGDDVALAGILWGGQADNSSFVFSPLAAVESELGAFDYFE